MLSLTRRDALRWLAATTAASAGCSGTDDPVTSTETARETTASPTQSATESATPQSAIDAVDGEWPSYGFDAANAGYVPSAQGPAKRPRVQWRTDVSTGTGVPVVADETVVVPSSDEAIVVLDATDGSERWRQNFSGLFLPSPAIAEDVVLAAGESLRAFAASDGTERWSYGSFDEVFGGLTVDDGAVYACANEAVHAVDVAAGERRWRTEFPDASSIHGSPAIADGTLVVRTGGSGFQGLVALDVADGTERWRADFGADVSVPTIADGTVYVGVERAYTDPYDDPTVFAVDTTTGDATPLFRTPGRRPPTIALSDEGLVVYENLSDPPDGPPTENHTHIETEPGQTPEDSEEEKPTHVYGLARDGTEQWVTTVAEATWAGTGWDLSTPAVAGGVAHLVLQSGHVLALDTATGEEQWRVEPTDFQGDTVGPAVVDGVVFVGGDGGVLALA